MSDSPPPSPPASGPRPAGEGEMISIYKIGKTIGQGTYGKVRMGINTTTDEKVAIKLIEKSQIQSPKQVARLQREIRFLKLLHHPHIVKVHEVIETTDFIYIMMEYAAGGELFDYIVMAKRVKEREAREFFRQVLSAVDYCHKNAVIHRDLKPENLLLDDRKIIKIIDFGFGNNFTSEGLLDTFCGSPFYAAPEMILGKKYEGPEVDMWSLGVILFALLCGHLPFDDDNMKELYKKIASGSYTCPDYLMPSKFRRIEGQEPYSAFGNHSTTLKTTDARHLIGRLITVDPKERATLPEVLAHPWVNENFGYQPPNYLPERPTIPSPDHLSREIVSRLCAFGYKVEDIKHAFAEGVDQSKPDPVRATYWLLQEMLEREQQRVRSERRKSLAGVMGRNGAVGGSLPNMAGGRKSADEGGAGRSGLVHPRLHFHSQVSMGGEGGGAEKRLSTGSLEGKESGTVKRDYGSLQQDRRRSTPDHGYKGSAGQVGSPLGATGTSIRAPQAAKVRNVSPHEGKPVQELRSDSSGDLGGGRASVFGRPSSADGSAGTINTTSVRRGSFAASASPTNATSKLREELRAVSGWFLNVSTTSSKPPKEIVDEVERVLSTNGASWQSDQSGFTLTCEVDVAKVAAAAGGQGHAASAAEHPQSQYQQQQQHPDTSPPLSPVSSTPPTPPKPAHTPSQKPSLIPRPTTTSDTSSTLASRTTSISSTISTTKPTSPTTLTAGGAVKSKSTVTFQIEICRVPRMNLYGLQFKRISGGVWNYKKVCNRLLGQMSL
ncbi:hypothetical protein HDV00_006370 [Rhizophlyctis rosea]|nr:hypothetical protein HDV00_006370 [Rhizophlyctis rosea]